MAGLLKKKKEREGGEIPTASMADIAFLLLIFFLVTTTINVDTGIGMTLPPKLEEDQEPPPVRERNMLKILVNEQGAVLIEDRPASIPMVRDEVKKHTLNEGADPNYAESIDLAIVSLKTARQTPYDTYINVLDEIWMAYREMWDAEARNMGYPSYAAYQEYRQRNDIEVDAIRDKIKPQLSKAEPEGEDE